jgi:DNA invertase Pin-like site-specific DNA recombinase
MTTSSTICAVTYRRVSTFQQRDGTSPETQLARGKALIERMGWEHVGDFYDGGVSGAKQSRGDLDRLFEMCRLRLVDVVVVGDLLRLSRDMRNSLNFEYELARLGVKVIDVDAPDADEMARMFTYLQGHWQRQQIFKVTRRGILAVAEQGYWPGGAPPIGWKIVDDPDNPKRKRAVLNEAEATAIRKAAELILDDRLTTWGAAARLNALGLFSRKGHRWTATHVRRILQRDHLAGEWVMHASEGDITIKGPPILDDDRGRAADRMRELRKVLDETAFVKPGLRVYPLSGRVTGPCGQPYAGTYRPDRDLRQYTCRTNEALYNGTGRRCWCPKVEANWLEETVWGEVTRLLRDPDRLLGLAKQYMDLRGGEMRVETTQISDLDRKLAAAKRRRTNLALAAADTGPEAVADALAEVNRDIDALDEMLRQARAWAQANAERAALVRDLERLARVAQERLEDPTPERMREVFAGLDVRVKLTDEGIRHRRHVRPALRISGVLVGDLAELSADLGNLVDAPPSPSGRSPGW